MEKSLIKEKFLSGELSLPDLIKEFTKEHLDGAWIVNHSNNFTTSTSYLHDIQSQMTNNDDDLQSRLHFKDINFDYVYYEEGATPQDWDFREVLVGHYPMVLFVFFDNNWWLGCDTDGLRTYEQVQEENAFKGMIGFTNVGLRPKFLNT